MNTKKVFKRKSGKPIKVTIFSNGPNLPTGYGKVIRQISTRLRDDDRFEVSLIDELASHEGAKEWEGIPVYGLQLPIRGAQRDRGQTAEATAQVLEQIRPDILMFLEDSFTLHNLGFERMLKVPFKKVFYMPLDGDWIPETGMKIVRSMDELVAMSKFTQDSLKKEGFDSEVIWHGVDSERFHPVTDEEQAKLKQNMGFKPDDYLIYNYGRNSNIRKNNQGLLWSVAKYLSTAPSNHHFLMHTLNPEHPGNNLFDYIKRHLVIEFGEDVVRRIHFSPFRKDKPANDDQMAAMLMASDMVVTASTGEGFGLIMAEGMACAKPIVSNEYTTPKELLVDEFHGIGPRGFTVPIATEFVAGLNTEHAYVNKEKFAETMQYVVDNPDEANKRAMNGRLFAEKFLNWDYLVEEWKHFFQRIL